MYTTKQERIGSLDGDKRARREGAGGGRLRARRKSVYLVLISQNGQEIALKLLFLVRPLPEAYGPAVHANTVPVSGR
jgi:hypothetical protein